MRKTYFNNLTTLFLKRFFFFFCAFIFNKSVLMSNFTFITSIYTWQDMLWKLTATRLRSNLLHKVFSNLSHRLPFFFLSERFKFQFENQLFAWRVTPRNYVKTNPWNSLNNKLSVWDRECCYDDLVVWLHGKKPPLVRNLLW